MRFEHLSQGIRTSIERGSDKVAYAARRGAIVGGLVGGMLGALLVSTGYIIGVITHG